MKTLRSILVIVAVAATILPAFAQSAQETAERAYKKFARFMERQDVDGMAGMLAPEFVAVDPQGKSYDKATSVAMMREMGKDYRKVKATFVVTEAYGAGDEVTAWVRMDVSGLTYQGGKWVPSKFSAKFVETLAKKPDGWKFVHSATVPD